MVAPAVEEIPDYYRVEIWNSLIGKETSSWFVARDPIQLDQEEARTIGDFGAFLWVWGYVTYTDFTEQEFIVGYLGRWDTAQGFIREPLAQYQYNKRKAQDRAG